MEGTQGQDFARAAASVEAEGQAEPAQAPKAKRTRRPKAQAAQAEPVTGAPPAGEPVEIRLNVDPEQLRKAMGPLLTAMARVTRTAGPTPDETKGMADTLAFGLSHTKIAMNEQSGPWVPLAVMVVAYTVPRALEKLMEVAERKGAPEGGTFRPALAAESRPEMGKAGDADTVGPVAAVGAV